MSVEVDLHLHTTESDGRLGPAELVNFVAGRGLKIVAITDHDITDGLEPAWEAAKAYPDLHIIPGIELSTDIPGNEIHILGYYIDHGDREFQATLQCFRESRVGRAKEMVDKLGDLGLPLDWERVKEIAGQGAIGRPHIAQAMVEKGYVSLPAEAFQRYIGRNGPAYAERVKQTPEEAIQLVSNVGGVPVIAHPAQMENLDSILEKLRAAGLKGMEVHYAEYNQPTRDRLAETARRHGLLLCGGSDYHALGVPGEHLPGEAGPPLEVAHKLREMSGSGCGGDQNEA